MTHGKNYHLKQAWYASTGRRLASYECERCHRTLKGPGARHGMIAHHADYARPDDITWLCRACHQAVHYPKLT